jgi:hypothetical protein
MPDISGLLPTAGVALEQVAFTKFGAAVLNQADGKLAASFAKNGQLGAITQSAIQDGVSLAETTLLNAVTGTPTRTAVPGANSEWTPTHYAAALASGQGNYDPKMKFLFKVSFTFYSDLIDKVQQISNVDLRALMTDLTFIVKQIDLPKYNFEYEEVNLYNFRTKVLKRIEHQDLSFMFYDDTGNRGTNLFNSYLQLLSPIMRIGRDPSLPMEDHGFNFDQNPASLTTAMRSALGYTRKDIFSSITITQFYLQRGSKSQSTITATYANQFIFTNPRFISLDFNDQDHEQSGPMTLSAKFDYDSLFLQTGEFGEVVNEDLPNLGTGDILLGQTSNATAFKRQSQSQQGGAGGPFSRLLSGTVGRLTSAAAGTLMRQVGISPGGGVVSGPLASTLGGVAGSLGTSAQRTLLSVTSGSQIPQGISLPQTPVVSDSNSPSSNTASQVNSTENPPT